MSTDLPRPDPAAVRDVSARLATMAAAADELARAWAALHDPRWRGPAADAARDRLALFAHPLDAVAAQLRAVAGALAVHATVLDEAVIHLDRAAELARDGERQAQSDVGFFAVTSTGLEASLRLDTPSAGPAAAVAVHLRSAAEAMIAESGKRTAAVITALGRPPSLVTFHERDLGLDARGAGLEENLLTRPVGTATRWVAQDPTDAQERFRVMTDEHGAEPAAIVMDGLGMMPVVGIPTDIVHLGFDLLRGDAEGVAWDGVGFVPLLGDAAQSERLAMRLSRRATESMEHGAFAFERLDRLHKGDEYAGKIAAALAPGTTTPALPAPGSVIEAATAKAAGVPGPSLPSDQLDWALLTRTATTWHPVPGDWQSAPRFLRSARAERWQARIEVEQGDRLIGYDVVATRAGALVGEPMARTNRPLPPDVDRPRRAWNIADDEGRPEALPVAVSPTGRGR